MLNNLPCLAIPAVHKGKAGLYFRAVVKGKGVHAGVNGDIAKYTHIGLVDNARRATI